MAAEFIGVDATKSRSLTAEGNKKFAGSFFYALGSVVAGGVLRAGLFGGASKNTALLGSPVQPPFSFPSSALSFSFQPRAIITGSCNK